ncbi:hypothetical protein HN748_03340 [Candidatus Peregrinibacteria bacterium]|jgi:hypothetical protein|nr:hypothetical protein [Candidatus Peregrinibacteria bacterium]MBT7484233.1 hypothetical protein [Candidatus Peregrinibacteria bacterium]MBT7703242.1 hypothetical protein [Candidatus Peregrinibacteria bacterium]
MDDITLPHEEKDDDSILIRAMDDDDKDMEIDFEKTAISDEDLGIEPPKSVSNTVTVNFAKFVQLVANHSFIDIVEKNAEEEVVISGNLLTDLANSHDRGKEKRMPIMFLAGLVLGIILTYIILN